MNFPLLPFITFSIVTIFTPGPNNISSMGFGLRYGYRGTLKYLIGICIGSFCVLLMASFFSELIGRYVPKLFTVLKYAGTAYIVFLSVQMIVAAFSKKKKEKSGKASLVQGILLQFLNPKGLVYAFTVFTVFVHPYPHAVTTVILIILLLMAAVFASLSLYTIGGNVVKAIIKRDRVYKAILILLALALLYSAAAIALSDIPGT